MRLGNNCGTCAAAVSIDGKSNVVGCKKDMRRHNIGEEKECFYDCATCVYSHDIEACRRKDAGFECRYEELLKRTCPTCGKEVYKDEMRFTKDCHGVPLRKVCHICYTRLMAKGYDGEYYTEADEQIDEDY